MRIHRFLAIALSALLLFSFTSCGNNAMDLGSSLYYVRSDKAGIAPVEYNFSSNDTEGMIKEALKALAEDNTDINMMNTIPAGVDIRHWELNDGNLSLYFVGDYESLDVYTEILVRAAIVKSLTQIKGVDAVSFYVNDSPLTDSNGDSIGQMTADTFIEDFGQETDSLLSTELTLYFASANGLSTVAETREVYYSRNVSKERLVIEQLIKGPESNELLSAIPSGTKLNSITVSEDGVCIVNFDATIETTITGITENVTVYSIVNSLTELDNIKSVKILVNGETPHISNVDADLSSSISRNEEIIATVSEDDEEQEFVDEEEIVETQEE